MWYFYDLLKNHQKMEENNLYIALNKEEYVFVLGGVLQQLVDLTGRPDVVFLAGLVVGFRGEELRV